MLRSARTQDVEGLHGNVFGNRRLKLIFKNDNVLI
jgi:hypothetical protein